MNFLSESNSYNNYAETNNCIYVKVLTKLYLAITECIKLTAKSFYK